MQYSDYIVRIFTLEKVRFIFLQHVDKLETQGGRVDELRCVSSALKCVFNISIFLIQWYFTRKI